MPDPARVQRCGFCSRVFEEGEKRRYIYPLPAPERSNAWDGRLACGGCFPEVQARQTEQGLISRLGG